MVSQPQPDHLQADSGGMTDAIGWSHNHSVFRKQLLTIAKDKLVDLIKEYGGNLKVAVNVLPYLPLPDTRFRLAATGPEPGTSHGSMDIPASWPISN